MRSATLSGAATQLLRALIARTGLNPAAISIGRFHSVDWHSLTFTGERHEISLQLGGDDPAEALVALRDGLADVDWRLRGHVVADIVMVGEQARGDGSILVEIEALTLTD